MRTELWKKKNNLKYYWSMRSSEFIYLNIVLWHVFQVQRLIPAMNREKKKRKMCERAKAIWEWVIVVTIQTICGSSILPSPPLTSESRCSRNQQMMRHLCLWSCDQVLRSAPSISWKRNRFWPNCHNQSCLSWMFPNICFWTQKICSEKKIESYQND